MPLKNDKTAHAVQPRWQERTSADRCGGHFWEHEIHNLLNVIILIYVISSPVYEITYSHLYGNGFQYICSEINDKCWNMTIVLRRLTALKNLSKSESV